MIFGKKLLFINFILFGVFFAGSVSADTCPTASPAGVGCNSGQYYCGGKCQSMTSCPTWTPSSICAAGLNCDNCDQADLCGVCSSCINNQPYTLCGTYPNKECKANTTPPDHCKTYNQCTELCSDCDNGYSLEGNQCVEGVLRLGSDSASGATAVVQSTNNTLMYISGTGVSIGTSTIPASTVLNVAGASFLSDDLSMVGDKSIKLDNASANTTLLIGNYGDGQVFGYGTSTSRTASLAVEGDVKAGRLCIQEDCKAAWSEIVSAGGGNQWTTSGNNIYNSNSGNVGINDIAPANKLSVVGDISSSGSLQVYGTDPAAMNYFASDLGIGGLPSGGGWQRYVDLSNASNATYLVRAGDLTSAVISTQSGRPTGTGFDFKYLGPQMVVGTLTRHPLNFVVGANTAMFLSDRGNVGIGTINPTARLDVDGNFRIKTITNSIGDIVTVSSTGVITKRTAEEIRDDIAAAKKINSLYYVEGNTTGTAGTWTGNIDGLDAYYDGLTIAYKIGIAGASTNTLNINSLGAQIVLRNTAKLTTHLPVGTVVVLTYTTISSTGYWVWADYDSDTIYYLRWTGPNVIAGETTTRYKIIMEGHDGRFYPLTIGNSTSANGKTVSSAKFKMNGQILYYSYSTQINENATFTSTNLYSDYSISSADYTFNKLSGWTAGKAVYLVGTINDGGYFVLDGAGTTGTDFMSQDLPTGDNGKVYILLGYMSNDTYGFKLTPDRVAYHFKDGKIRLYESMSGTGSANYITKWASSTALGNSQIYDNGTNVGIGTTSPTSLLDVNGLIKMRGAQITQPEDVINQGYLNSALSAFNSNTNLWKLSSNKIYASSTDWNIGIGTTDPGTAKLAVMGGNVGIGTTSPSQKLHVQGNAYVSGWIQGATAIIGENMQAHYVYPTGDTDLIIQTRAATNRDIIFKSIGTTPNESMRITTAGNVGIGTTSPTSLLDVNGLIKMRGAQITQPEDVINQGYLNSALSAFNSNTNLWKLSGNKIYASSTDWNIGIGTTDPGTAKLAVMGGNVGIGTTNPRSGLDVGDNDIYIGNHPTTRKLYFGNDTNYFGRGTISTTQSNLGLFNTYATGYITLNTNGSERLRVNYDGNVGIGTTSPTSLLDVNGLIKMRGAQITQPEDVINQGYLNSALSAFNSNTNLWKLSGNKIYASSTDWNIGIGTNDPGTARLAVMGGNVGIGTTAPSDLLHLSKSVGNDYISSSITEGTNLRITNTANNWQGAAGIILGNLGATIGAGYSKISSIITSVNSSDLAFQVSNNGIIAEAIRIVKNGNVGIGTTTPGVKLEVNGYAIANTPTANNHLTTKSYVDAAVQNSYSYFVTTTALFDGDRGGYVAADELCNAVEPGSHVCNTDDILNTIRAGQSAIIPVDSRGMWISNGPPGYTVNANDCIGYNSNNSNDYGAIWVKVSDGTAEGYGSLRHCNDSAKFACCK